MGRLAAGIQTLPRARWWLITSAFAFLSSWLPLFVAGRRNDAWETSAIARHCLSPIPHTPDNRLLGWAVVGLVAIGVIGLVGGLIRVLIGSNRWWVKLGSAVIAAALLLAALWLVLIGLLLTDSPSPAREGLDGAGLPCLFAG